MKKTEYQFSESTRLHSRLCRLYRIKELLLWAVLVGTFAWVMLYLVDSEKGMELLPIKVLNILILGVVIVLDARYRRLLKKLYILIDKE
tara:strand:+ start:574 stop:840 length:267 start_codon:yes stop_codon:yes gene_type:complete